MIPDSYAKEAARRGAAKLIEMELVGEVDERTVCALIERGFIDELRVAAKLEREAAKLLEAHKTAARAQGADLAELKERIIVQLARQKGVVLR